MRCSFLRFRKALSIVLDVVVRKHSPDRDRRVSHEYGRAPTVRVAWASAVTVAAFAVSALACADDSGKLPPDAIVIGSLLPFTGGEAALGSNLEQAMLLAVEDVNAAGGVHGRPLALISRDSNSGSSRGLDGLLGLLYTDQVRYLIGPEEGDLANEIVSDIKALDVLNVLPGYTAPSVRRSTSSGGAWMRLAPS